MIMDKTHVIAAMWKNGRRTGLLIRFDTMSEAVDQIRTLSGTLPPDVKITKIAWNERVPDSQKDGWVIEQIKTRHHPGDASLEGERITA